MPTITFPELTEVDGKLNDRRKKLRDVFVEAGDTLDMTKVKSLDGDSPAKVEAIRAINAEIDELAVKREGLVALQQAANHGADYREPGDQTPTSSGGVREQKSLGRMFVESDGYKSGAKSYQTEMDIDLKATFTTTSWAPEVTRGPRLVDYATRPIELLDLIPTTNTNQSAVTYMEETTFTNNAAEVAEEGSKPQAELGLTEQSSPVRKIAVLLPVTDETLEDEPRAEAYINNRLPFMVRQRLSLQIAVGDGSAPNLSGILDQSGIQTQAKGSDPVPDAVYKAMVKVMTTGQAMPDAFVTNPLDWQDVRLLRTADGIYIWGNPSEAGPQRIWGLNVVLVQAMTQNTGVVGDFGNFSELAIKKGLTVDVGYDTDDFKKNRRTFRAEMRAALIWYRHAAFCSVTSI